jgi:hypothetical protein
MRRVRWHVDRFTRPQQVFLAAERSIELALEYGERLFEVMTVRRGATAWRNVHVDQAELARRVFASKKDCVRIPDHSYMGKLTIRLRNN